MTLRRNHSDSSVNKLDLCLKHYYRCYTVLMKKKLQFNHVLTATRINLPIENSKNDKKVILATITSTKCQCAAE